MRGAAADEIALGQPLGPFEAGARQTQFSAGLLGLGSQYRAVEFDQGRAAGDPGTIGETDSHDPAGDFGLHHHGFVGAQIADRENDVGQRHLFGLGHLDANRTARPAAARTFSGPGPGALAVTALAFPTLALAGFGEDLEGRLTARAIEGVTPPAQASQGCHGHRHHKESFHPVSPNQII